MIRINLLTEKRRKSIPIGNLFPAIFVIISLCVIGVAWFVGADYLSTYNDDVKKQKDEIEAQINKEQSQVKKRDDLKSEIGKVNRKIAQLEQISGANLVQWSKTLSTLSSVVPEKTVWITNLRIDSDRRVQITAYSCNEDGKPENKEGEARLTLGIQKFVDTLMKNPLFNEVFLTSATKNIYEKMPVWRFEINCRLARDLANR